MRSVFIYIIIALQVTSFGQSVHFKFEDFEILKIESIETIIFKNNYFDDSLYSYQQLNYKFKLSGEYSIDKITTIPCTEEEIKILRNWSWTNNPKISIQNGISNDTYYSQVKVYPFHLKNSVPHKITAVSLSLSRAQNKKELKFRSNQNISKSVLSKGNWFKFKIHESGVHELSYEKLVELNVLKEPLPKENLAVYSNSSRMLDFNVGNKRPTDLSEIPTQITGTSSTTFGPGSKILFYAEANGHDHYDTGDNYLKKEINLYSDTNYVFLIANSKARKNISTNSLINPNNTIYDYTKMNHHEKELVNFIKSGREWVGENFTENPITFKQTYKPPLYKNSNLKIKYKTCARSNTSIDNKMSLIINNDTVSSGLINKVSSVHYTDYVKFLNKDYSIENHSNLGHNKLNIHFYYHQTENQKAWIDYFTINTTERIQKEENQTIINIADNNNLVNSINILSSIKSTSVWDITNYNETFELKTFETDSGFKFNSKLDTIRRFILFEEENCNSPEFVNKVSNQNLHGLKPTNYLIITKNEFFSQADRLIDLHERRDNISGQRVSVSAIYNEFSSGRPEATAIRDFIKTIYDKGKSTDDSLCYVLLLGEGSYDPKNRINNNINFIPTFQSLNSNKLTSSYVTDDFYGLMDDHEGTYSNGDLLDLGIGRIPIKNEIEAKNTINKIFEYYDEYAFQQSSTSYERKLLTSKGNWRNNIVFVADDGDNNEHMRQANSLAEKVDSSISFLNQKKIFVDAFPQSKTSIGEISPEANKKLVDIIEKGALIINYTGHGGEEGWTSERIYLINDILSMKNRNKLPLFMTATCEFSRFDSPEGVSAGEHLILQPKGGAIALFTTVRLVFSIPNFKLNESFYSVLESSINNNKTTIGDLFKTTKVFNSGGVNDRNFTLLGDPALRLSIPTNKVILDSVSYSGFKTDTIKSLSAPTLHGKVQKSNNSNLLDFNGWIDILLFDKEQKIVTLANDKDAKSFSFNSQEDLLFLGKAKVTNGSFKSEIFIPKDTRKNFNTSRLSFYAVDSNIGDASGYNENIIIGGTAKNKIEDNIGPSISLYLDDTSFVFGDNVTPSPIFIASLIDSSGINIIPNDIGKDLVLTINKQSDLNFVLNNYYTPSITSYKKGEVIFPIDELEEGRHSLEFKAFDNQNNSSKAYTEFIIEKNPKLALKHLLNYPNPFTTNTGFYFEHNQTSENLEIFISIYTITGKIIKTIEGIYSGTSKRIGPIEWDGLDQFGDKIGKGVYVYQITVKNNKGETDKGIQKLVLLR